MLSRKNILGFTLGLVLSLGLCRFVHEKYSSYKNKDEHTISLTGTIMYYNYELDRGSGIVSPNPIYGVQFIPEVGSLYHDPILLGCAESGSTILGANVLKIDTIKGVDNSNRRSRNMREYNKKQNYRIPNDLSGKQVFITITKPITSYLLNVDIPDTQRPGDCTAFSEIKNIVIL